MNVSQTDFPLHLFHHGENFKAYELMGAHPAKHGRKHGYVFRVWAPRAESVSVVGEFNEWNIEAHVMHRMIDGETFELFIPSLKEFDAYKYCIKTADGRTLFKADPYAYHAETPGTNKSNASKLYNLADFAWSDREYLDKRNHTDIYTSPMNIYEVNLLSWKLHEDGRRLRC